MNKDYFSFKGEGSQLLLIYLKNIFLSLFTLGLYIPWAIVNTAQYVYEHIEFKERRFAYTGTGKEIFKGFIMAILILIGAGLVIYLVNTLGSPMLSSLVIMLLYIGYIVAIPYILHKALKYDYANTTYAGIRFGYRGQLEEFIKLFLKGLFLTLVTLGIYGAWFTVEIKKYITKHTRLGNVEFEFVGEGMELFLINLKGIFFTILSMGIYMFWWFKNTFNFHVENTRLHFEGNTYSITSDAEAGKIFKLFVVNALIVVFTLGLGVAWANVRTYRFICENCAIENDVDVDRIKQTEPTYHDAIGVGTLEAMSN